MQPTSLERQARAIERWKSKKGITGRDYVPANNGARLTDAKRALLRALAELVTDDGGPTGFSAKF